MGTPEPNTSGNFFWFFVCVLVVTVGSVAGWITTACIEAKVKGNDLQKKASILDELLQGLGSEDLKQMRRKVEGAVQKLESEVVAIEASLQSIDAAAATAAAKAVQAGSTAGDAITALEGAKQAADNARNKAHAALAAAEQALAAAQKLSSAAAPPAPPLENKTPEEPAEEPESKE